MHKEMCIICGTTYDSFPLDRPHFVQRSGTSFFGYICKRCKKIGVQK